MDADVTMFLTKPKLDELYYRLFCQNKSRD